MKSKYKSYPSYRDSGVEWFGEIPNHWDAVGFKRYFESIVDYRGKTPEKVDSGIFLVTARNIKKGAINYSASSEYVKTEDYNEIMSRGVPQIGDILFTTEAPLGEVANIDNTDIALAQRVIKFRAEKDIQDNYYLKYLMMSAHFQNSLMLFASGSTALGIKAERLVYLRKLLPTIQEQQAIAKYLDSATAKIDTLIEKQTKLIALLKEKRQAVISTAVTRGLDNTVAMKDSGVEWLGEVPEHWDVKKLKFIAYAKPSNVDKKSKDDEKNVLLCNYTDVYYNDFITNDIEFMKATATDEQIKKFTLEIDDVIITKDSEGAEDIAIATCVQEVQDNLVCGYHLTHIKPTSCNGRYLFRAFNSDGIHDQFKVAANGITRYGIGVYGIDNAWFPVPPSSEQEEIAKHIDDKTSKIDNLISKSSKTIDLLKEKRTALISSSVTGKIDVREVS